jgi:hypothetical protein
MRCNSAEGASFGYFPGISRSATLLGDLGRECRHQYSDTGKAVDAEIEQYDFDTE